MDEVASISNRLFSTPQGGQLLNGGRLGFVSPRHTRACATLTRDMAAHLACRQRSVALVEMDVRTPVLAQLCGFSDAAGWTDRGRGDETVSPVRPVSESIVLVPAGNTRVDPLSVDDRVLENVLEELGSGVDVTLVTLPPLLDAPEALTMLGPLDQVVLTIPAGELQTKELRRAKDLLAASGASIAGSVLVDAEYPLPTFLSSLL